MLCVPTAGADEASDPFGRWAVVPDSELADMRGGFITGDGLDIRFGLEQIVLVDGTVQSRTSLNLSSALTQSASATPQQIDQNKLVLLVQNGANNTLPPEVLERYSAGLMTVIQNSADMQTIQNLTVLNIGVSNLSAIPQRELGTAVDLGLMGILR